MRIGAKSRFHRGVIVVMIAAMLEFALQATYIQPSANAAETKSGAHLGYTTGSLPYRGHPTRIVTHVHSDGTVHRHAVDGGNVTIEDPTVWARPWTVNQEFSRQSEEENRLYTEPRCIEGNQGLPGLLHGRRVEDLAFAQGRGPDPAATDNTANFATTEDLEDPLAQ